MKERSHFWTNKVWHTSIFVLLMQGTALLSYAQQGPNSLDRDRAHVMLQAIKSDLKKNYYDPNYHGMDIESRFKTADEKLKQATSLGQLFGIIAQTLDDLNDSHTFFVPPGRSYRIEYGWQMQMSGNKCFVVTVKPGSDAEAKGLKEGDEIYSIDGIGPVRENMWKIQYLYHALRPRPGVRLLVIKPDGKQQQLDILSKVQQGKREMDLTGSLGRNDLWDLVRESESASRLHRHRYIEKGKDLFIWKMPEFDMTRENVDNFVDKFRNHIKLPTAADLAARRDPVLSYAASLFWLEYFTGTGGGAIPD